MYTPKKIYKKLKNKENPFIEILERINYELFQIGRLLLYVVLNDYFL
jgi:hypothetical protein